MVCRQTLCSVDLLQESGTRTYPTQKQPSCGRNSLSLSSAKHGTAERDLHADISSAGLLQEVYYVSNGEDVLDVYQRPYHPKRPVVCCDETRKGTPRHTTRNPMCASGGSREARSVSTTGLRV